MKKLTVKQERFAQKYIELGNASEAYRQSFDASRCTDKSVHELASKMLKREEVGLKVEQLQKEHAERHAVTIESLTMELEEARSMAIIEKQNAAAVSATMGKAKIHGIGSEKVDANVNVTIKNYDFDSSS